MSADTSAMTSHLQSRRPSTLSDYVEAEIHRSILSGVFPGGYALRITELAQHYDMSTMPVREALQRLAGIGLVEIIPRKGARVLELSVADLEDTYETRAQLESLAVRKAAESFDAAAAEAAGSALEAHVAALADGDVDRARTAHQRFHFAVYEACGSRWLIRSIEPAWRNSERYRFAAISDASHQEQSDREHQTLLDACIRNSPNDAEVAMRNHLSSACGRIRKAMLSLKEVHA